MLRDMAQCGKTRCDSHACKNLHRLLHSRGYTVPVNITTVTTPVRLVKRGVTKKCISQYPVLRLSDWCRCIFQTGGQFLLAGLTLQDDFGQTLRLFWQRYQQIEAEHPFFKQHCDAEWEHCIPYLIHGDEGRGAGKKPVMVISAQPLITSPDMSEANQRGFHSSISSIRLLFG